MVVKNIVTPVAEDGQLLNILGVEFGAHLVHKDMPRFSVSKHFRYGFSTLFYDNVYSYVIQYLLSIQWGFKCKGSNNIILDIQASMELGECIWWT